MGARFKLAEELTIAVVDGYVRWGFGLTVPSAFANYVGGRLLPVKDKGIKTLEDQWGLLR